MDHAVKNVKQSGRWWHTPLIPALGRQRIKITVIRTTYIWGWLRGSEVQSSIIKVGTWQCLGRHGAGGAESSLHLKAAERRLLAGS